MNRINSWNENEMFSSYKIAQDVFANETIGSGIDTSCGKNMKTSCCIDTTKITSGPCGSDIQTSCCIDTTKE